MTKMVADQADGLRRLLAHTPTRVVAVARMERELGATTAAMNLGAALVQQGKDVLLLDEHGRPAIRLRRLVARSARRAGRRGLRAPDLRGRARRSPPAASRAAGAARRPARSTDPRGLWQGGVVLIDAVFDGEGRLSPLAQMADELVLVLQPHRGIHHLGLRGHQAAALRAWAQAVALPGQRRRRARRRRSRSRPTSRHRQPLPGGVAGAGRLGALPTRTWPTRGGSARPWSRPFRPARRRWISGASRPTWAAGPGARRRSVRGRRPRRSRPRPMTQRAHASAPKGRRLRRRHRSQREKDGRVHRTGNH